MRSDFVRITERSTAFVYASVSWPECSRSCTYDGTIPLAFSCNKSYLFLPFWEPPSQKGGATIRIKSPSVLGVAEPYSFVGRIRRALSESITLCIQCRAAVPAGSTSVWRLCASSLGGPPAAVSSSRALFCRCLPGRSVDIREIGPSELAVSPVIRYDTCCITCNTIRTWH